ncbi:MAG TPA: LuxR C-terminal-related transcriptional regulator, partial [Amycolatopsis sp.]|nr:LuxR C-terminal-related transcriptional regulator [Amycolatopsis sp.]
WLARAEAEASGLGGAADPALWSEAVRAFGYGAVYEQAVCRWQHAEALLGVPADPASAAAGVHPAAAEPGVMHDVAAEPETAPDLAEGIRSAAAAELGEAHAVAERLHATPLRDAVRDVAKRARLDLPGAPLARSRPAVADPFTERERAVLERVALGRTNRQVGDELFISEKTVSVHLSRVMAKLGAARRAEAVAIAYDRGLLTKPDHAPAMRP